MQKALISWSGGKDSALSLYRIQRSGYLPSFLLTTITEDYDRISMHGVRTQLLEKQASSLGLTLEKVLISKEGGNEEYEFRLRKVLEKSLASGVSSVVFGDIFLEDLRAYREKNLARLQMNGIFPIWKEDTRSLAEEFIKLRFRAIVTCVDTKFLDKRFAGRIYDEDFLSEIPDDVDPCGENGEFHTFVFDGPNFSKPVKFKKGIMVLRDGRFFYCDLIP